MVDKPQLGVNFSGEGYVRWGARLTSHDILYSFQGNTSNLEILNMMRSQISFLRFDQRLVVTWCE